MMPGMDGYEVCQHLRQVSTTVNVPIIMLTALDQVDSKVHGFRTGADDYVTKPFDLQELRTRVETHLRRSARDQSASPLTGLPGNRMIEQTLAARIKTAEPMAVLYVDLTNFKAYNDVYGWLKGDQIIRLLGTMLTNVVGELGGASDFVGHVGGDDFVVVSTPQHAATIAQQVIHRFDVDILDFYNEETRARGYSIVKDRRGKLYHAPLATVAIAIVTNAHREFENPTEIAALAAEVKQYVKSRPGSHYAFDRRTK
jgi:diguanylate cyclase (GGDEF)-like protein